MKILKKVIITLIVMAFLVEIVSYLHASRFSHYEDIATGEAPGVLEISFWESLKMMVTGIPNPRPKCQSFDIFYAKEDSIMVPEKISITRLEPLLSRGTVLLFPGFQHNKSSNLKEAKQFYAMGYNAILVDFRGEGCSDGNRCSIGYNEAEDVKLVFEWAKETYPDEPLFLYGSSMGGAAVLRALDVYQLPVNGAILGAPFGSLRKAAGNRFALMGLPEFPLADLLTINIGLINDYWGYDNNPEENARNVEVLVLLMFGLQDDRISKEEIINIYENLKGPKRVEIYESLGHESYYYKTPRQWNSIMTKFLERPLEIK